MRRWSGKAMHDWMIRTEMDAMDVADILAYLSCGEYAPADSTVRRALSMRVVPWKMQAILAALWMRPDEVVGAIVAARPPERRMARARHAAMRRMRVARNR